MLFVYQECEYHLFVKYVYRGPARVHFKFWQAAWTIKYWQHSNEKATNNIRVKWISDSDLKLRWNNKTGHLTGCGDANLHNSLTSASSASWGHFLGIKLKNCSTKTSKQLFTFRRERKGRDWSFWRGVSTKTATKTTLFVHKQYLTSRRSTCLFEKGLAWLLSFAMKALNFWKTKFYMYHFSHAKFDGKTVFNEEMLVN